MSEFGHVYGGGKGFRFDGWGVGPFVIEAEGKRFRFGDSDTITAPTRPVGDRAHD